MKIILKRGHDKLLRKGYPWVFSNQIAAREGDPSSGDVVEIRNEAGHLYGRGLYHTESLIAVRFLTSDPVRPIDEGFFRERLRDALDLREGLFPRARHYRLVFSESDGIPGTIIDRYGDVLTWTCVSKGIEQRRDWLLDALEEWLSPVAVIERNDSWLREKDGLPESRGVLRGTYDGPVEIEEDGVRFQVDVLEGPKTGFFIDQRFHRFMIRRFARGRRVLDVFCADGGFGLHAAAGGAESVHVLDISEHALARAEQNARLNGLEDRLRFEQANALDRLGELVEQRTPFDLVILDPPAFAKSRRHLEFASGAYQRINISAMQLLGRGGILATASCSQALSEEDFLRILKYSMRRTRSRWRLLFRGTQPPDHPVLPVMPETQYLKFYVFQKLDDQIPEPPSRE